MPPQTETEHIVLTSSFSPNHHTYKNEILLGEKGNSSNVEDFNVCVLLTNKDQATAVQLSSDTYSD